MRPQHFDPYDVLASCCEEPMGFLQRSTDTQIRVFLDRDFDTGQRETELDRLGFVIRRAVPRDMGIIWQFLARRFGGGRLDEVSLVMQQRPPYVHLALVDEEIVALAAYSTIRDECGDIGPIGTLEEACGLGLGQILLYRCMTDLQAVGHRTAVIPWVGSDAFYKRLLNCRFDRVSR